MGILNNLLGRGKRAVSSRAGTAPKVAKPPEPLIGTTGDKATIVVLLDGDADYFNRDYLTRYEGGRAAALNLHAEVLKWKRERDGPRTDVQILVQICWNQGGLEGHLTRTFATPINLTTFVESFNSSPFLFCIVNTGPGKEAADRSLEKSLRFHISRCDHLILGGTHDKGYGDILHQLNERDREKVVLLQTTTLLTKHTAALKLRTITFPGLFSIDVPKMSRAVRSFGMPTSSATDKSATLPIPPPLLAPPPLVAPVMGLPIAVSAPVPLAVTSRESIVNPVVSSPSMTIPTFVYDLATVPLKFVVLAGMLVEHRRQGVLQPLCSTIEAQFYRHSCGIHYGPKYEGEAQSAGIVRISQSKGTRRMELLGQGAPDALRVTHSSGVPASSATVNNATLPIPPPLLTPPPLVAPVMGLPIAVSAPAPLSVTSRESVVNPVVSSPSMTIPTFVYDLATVPLKFVVLAGMLVEHRRQGVLQPLCSTIEAQFYRHSCGIHYGPKYEGEAQSAGIVRISQSKGTRRMELLGQGGGPVIAPSAVIFRPLLEAVQQQHALGIKLPARTTIGDLVKRQYLPLYSSFKQYAAAAAAAGLVSLGPGVGIGRETIALANPIPTTQAVRLVTPVTTQTPAASTVDAVFPGRDVSYFRPLLLALITLCRTSGVTTLRSTLETYFKSACPSRYVNYSTYVAEAQHAGLIVLGGGISGATIALSTGSNDVQQLVASVNALKPVAPTNTGRGVVSMAGDQSLSLVATQVGPSPAPPIPLDNTSTFTPLLAALRLQKSKGILHPLRSTLGTLLKSTHPTLYIDFGAYVASAQRAGLVLLGPGLNAGGETISLPVLPLVPAVPALTPKSSSIPSIRLYDVLETVLREADGPRRVLSFHSLLLILKALKRDLPCLTRTGGWPEYLRKAEQIGIISILDAGDSSWVALPN